MKIGVLALQGAFAEHVSTLHAIGVEAVEVRLPEDLLDVDGLIIPGGESTTMRRLIDRWGLRQPILDLAESRRAAVRHLRGDDRPGARDRGRRGARPAAARRDGRAQRLRTPAGLVRDGARRPLAGRPAGARGVHPGARHRAGRAGRRRHREARRRPDRGGPRAERRSRRRSTPSSRARRASTASSRCSRPSTPTPARASAAGRIPPAARTRAASDGTHGQGPRRTADRSRRAGRAVAARAGRRRRDAIPRAAGDRAAASGCSACSGCRSGRSAPTT